MCFITAIYNLYCGKRPLNSKKSFEAYESDVSVTKCDDLDTKKKSTLTIIDNKPDRHSFDFVDVQKIDKKSSVGSVLMSNDTNSLNSSVVLNMNSSLLSLSSLSECSSCDSSQQSIVNSRLNNRPMLFSLNMNAKGSSRIHSCVNIFAIF